jgi:hypothetical protein
MLAGFQLVDSVYAIFRVHVHGTHEPPRLVSTDWQNGDVKGAASPGDRAKIRVKGSVSGKKERVIRCA